jgi:hypothetical protein
MPRARKELVSLEATPYYHCICRCVRRAFLCGARKNMDRKNMTERTWTPNTLDRDGLA